MNKAEYNKIISLYESHLQVKRLSTSGTIRLYIHSVENFFNFCEKYQKELVLPENWEIDNVGVRELEAFLKHQIEILHWHRSTIVTCVSGIKNFLNFLTEIQYLQSNPIQHFKFPRDLNEIGEQRFNILQINKLFENTKQNSLIGLQQRLLLELIYGLGMTLSKISNINSIVPELDYGSVRIYFKNYKFQDYPFNQSAIDILKSYLKKIDCIESERTFWINIKGKPLNSGQLQNLLNKYFESQKLPTINANELRDLSVQHFSQKGADIRSMQTLRKSKQIRKLQTLSEKDFDQLKNIIKLKHIRNGNNQEE